MRIFLFNIKFIKKNSSNALNALLFLYLIVKYICFKYLYVEEKYGKINF